MAEISVLDNTQACLKKCFVLVCKLGQVTTTKDKTGMGRFGHGGESCIQMADHFEAGPAGREETAKTGLHITDPDWLAAGMRVPLQHHQSLPNPSPASVEEQPLRHLGPLMPVSVRS